MCLYPLLLSFSLFLARRSLRLPSRPPRECLFSPLPRFLLSPVPFPFSPPRGLPRHFLVNYGRRTGEGRGVSARAPGPSSNPLPPRRYPRRTTWGTLNASAGSPWRHPLPAPPFSCSTSSSSSSPSSSSAPSRARGCLAPPPSPFFPIICPAAGLLPFSFHFSFLLSTSFSYLLSTRPLPPSSTLSPSSGRPSSSSSIFRDVSLFSSLPPLPPPPASLPLDLRLRSVSTSSSSPSCQP